MLCAVDLHIHSCLSPCGDVDMTPSNIAGMAYLKGLDVIALTDHNSCKNLPAIQKACAAYGVALLPGMEANSREEVHTLCYFPTIEAAQAFDAQIYPLLPPIPNKPDLFGEQQLRDENDSVIGLEPHLLISALDLGLDELCDLATAYGGVCVPAHINRTSNSLLANLGFLPPGAPYAALEVDARLPISIKTDPYMVLHSSDAHRLEAISERSFFLDIEERSAEAVLNHLLQATKH